MRSVRYLPAGPGYLLCFEKFAKPTSQNKAGTPALVRKLFRWASGAAGNPLLCFQMNTL